MRIPFSLEKFSLKFLRKLEGFETQLGNFTSGSRIFFELEHCTYCIPLTQLMANRFGKSFYLFMMFG